MGVQFFRWIMASRYGRWPSLAPEKHNLQTKTHFTQNFPKFVWKSQKKLTWKRWINIRWSLQTWKGPQRSASPRRTSPTASLQTSETTLLNDLFGFLNRISFWDVKEKNCSPPPQHWRPGAPPGSWRRSKRCWSWCRRGSPEGWRCRWRGAGS